MLWVNELVFIMWQGGTDALPVRHSSPKLGFLWFIKLGYYNFFQMKEAFGKKLPEDDLVLAICGPKVSL